MSEDLFPSARDLHRKGWSMESDRVHWTKQRDGWEAEAAGAADMRSSTAISLASWALSVSPDSEKPMGPFGMITDHRNWPTRSRRAPR
jgi:hypothetical protein